MSEDTIYAEKEVDLIALWLIVWRYKLGIALAAIVCGLLAVYVALTAVPVYRAETIVTEVQQQDMGATGALMSQLGGLASLAGLSIGAGGPNREAKAILESRRLAEEFVRRNDLVPVLFPESAPSLWTAVEEFRNNVLFVEEDARKGVIVIGIEWTDAAVAAAWANGVVALANELIRERAMEQAKRNIKYLNQQIGTTNVVELQSVMYNLIETETKTLMFASGRQDYAFTVVDPAVAPEMRIRPQRTVMVILGTVIGIFIGVFFAFSHNIWATQRRTAGAVA